jgi:hypothetical protein
MGYKVLEVIDDFLPNIFANSLEEMVKKEMPWFLNEDASGEGKNKNIVAEQANIKGFQFGFSHIAFDDNGYKSGFFDKVFPILYSIEQQAGVEVKELYRIRIALSTSMGTETQHFPHVDMKNPHKVLVYYVNDSDGDTFIYNEMYSEGLEKPSNFTLNKRITPKKNRAVLFDGLKYHSSSKPVNFPTRFIVNVDFN